jgi:hypothetical protein
MSTGMSSGVRTGMTAIPGTGTSVITETDMNTGMSSGVRTGMTAIPDTGTDIGVNPGTVLI